MEKQLKVSSAKFALRPQKTIIQADHAYPFSIINICNWQIYAIVDANGQEHPVTPISLNCFSDADTCQRNGSYSQLTTSDCNAQAYKFKIHAVYPPTGQKGETDWISVQPSCDYAGEVAVFNEPNPT